MTLVEDQLERFFGYGLDPPDVDAGVAAVDALATCDRLSEQRAAVWRERFERARRPRPRVDPDLRARCLALLELLDVEDDDGPLSALPTHLYEAGLIASSDYHNAIAPVRPAPPVAVALGPPPAPGGVHVIWVATYADRVELAMRDLSLEDAETDRIVLRSSDGTTHTGRGRISNNRGHMRFYARPTTSSVELLVGDELVTLDVP
jgi:hypothetical protein